MASPRFPLSSSSSSSASSIVGQQPIYGPSPLPPMPSTPEARIDQLLDHISPTEETDAARAEVFAFLRSVVDKCFAECKVREKEQKKKKNVVGGDGLIHRRCCLFAALEAFFFFFLYSIFQCHVEIEETGNWCLVSSDGRKNECMTHKKGGAKATKKKKKTSSSFSFFRSSG